MSPSSLALYLSLIITLSSICPVSCIYFYLGDSQKKCFLEDIPDDVTIMGLYKVDLYDPAKATEEKGDGKIKVKKIRTTGPEGSTGSEGSIGIHIEVTDPMEKTVLSRTYNSEGRFTFTSHLPGQHVICFQSNASKANWFSSSPSPPLWLHLDFKLGDHAIDYEIVGRMEKLTQVQLRVRKLLDRVQQISKEQNYQRYREERFRQTTDSTNQRVLLWAFIQIVVLLSMGYWQMSHLRYFFQVKKLV